MPNSLTIGKSIKKARKSKKITQKDLAEKTGYHVNIISRWETDLQIPNLRSAIAVADALEVSIDELVGRVFKLKPVESFPLIVVPSVTELFLESIVIVLIVDRLWIRVIQNERKPYRRTH